MTNNEALSKMKKCMILRGLSPLTQKNYLMHVEHFTRYFGMPLEDLNYDHVRDFLYDAIENRKLSGQYTNSVYSSIKFLYEIVFERDWNMKQIPRKKPIQRLPKILSMEEIKKLILSLDNIKHKAMLLTIYAGGLRVSEVTKLKITDIDSKNMQIFIRQRKGNKDRYSLLSQNALHIRRTYFKEYRPKDWLFPGRNHSEAISIKTVQAVFKQARAKANIEKPVTVHSLRHSFATHLIENGVDILYIKELMGHNSIQTTSKYIHLARKDVLKIISPADMRGGICDD